MLNRIWEEFLNIVSQESGSRIVDTWLKAVSLVKWDYLKKTIYIQAPNTFVKEWIRSNYLPIFSLHLGRLFNVDNINIVFMDQFQKDQVCEPEKIKIHDLNDEKKNNQITVTTKQNNRRSANENLLQNRSQINNNYQFSTFIVGPSNSLSYAAAYAVTQKPGVLYNPLFIYGGSGLGKTHLLHAIGNEIKAKHKDAIILYQTSDRFVNEFINAIRFDKIHLFKEKYKNIDVLLIDDIQFISNKDQTQEAFFHIFNSLYDARKQIVFSSDNYPKDIQGIAERLRSRLEWGLITDICVPTLETKIAILKKKAESNTEIIPDDVLHFIASGVDSNIRELEGSLVRVLAFANLTNQQISLELARKVLVNNLKQKSTNVVNFQHIAKCVGKKYALNLSDLQSKSRNKEISFARQVAMYMMKQVTDRSLHDIGVFLKRKDHSTVVHAINKIEKLKEIDQEFNIKMKHLEDEINR